MILAITMFMLLVISTLAASTLVNSFLERSLSRNQVSATIAQNAADAGISAGLGWLNDPATNVTIPSYATTPGWSVPLTATLTGVGTSTTSGESTYNVISQQSATYQATIRFRRELDADAKQVCDIGGCADNEVVLYNRCTGGPTNNCWGYTDSAFAAPGGYPIMVIHSEGRYGEGAQRIVELEVARDKFDVKATGAVTAASNVAATGNITIDGTSHDINGNPGGNCTTAYPGVSIPPPTWDQNGDGNCNCTNGASNGDADCVDAGEAGVMDRGCYTASTAGSAGTAGTPAGTGTNNVDPPMSPDAALGLDEGDLAQKLGSLPAAGSTLTKGNIVYINQDYDLSTGMTGVLIVHNPLFESRKYSWSDPVGEHYKVTFYDAAGASTVSCADRKAVDGSGNPVYPNYDGNLDTNCPGNFVADATYATQAAYRAAKAPRNLEQHGNNTFKGVIIADKVDKINGTADIIGALISLSTISTDILGNGAARILYSCDALSLYTDVGYSIKLSWHRIR
jgi:Tfp pilus assembly protein PilX